MSYDISDAKDDEFNFALASWKQSLRNSEQYRDVPTGAAFAVLNPHVNKLVDRSAVLMARQGKRLLGFVVFEVVDGDFYLHFGYVKHQHRRMGIGRELLLAALENSPGATNTYYTQPTRRFAALADRYNLVLAKVPQ